MSHPYISLNKKKLLVRYIALAVPLKVRLLVVHVYVITTSVHKQECVVMNLFPVEAMLWQLCMHNNDHEHADRTSTVILEAD